MAQRLICPDCRAKLYLRTPAVAATKVKCRECGNKFYVGHSLDDKAAAVPAAIAHDVAAVGVPAVTKPQPDYGAPEDSREQPLVAEPPVDNTKAERRRERRKHSGSERGLPKWLMPVGLAALAVALVLAIFFSSKPPETAKRSTSADGSPIESNLANVGETSKLLGGSKKMYARPPELCGVWELESDATSIIELDPAGRVNVSACLVDDMRLELQGNWYMVLRQGSTFTLEFGKEPSRVDNHRTIVTLEDDGRLRMSVYATAAPNGIAKLKHMFKKQSRDN